MIINQFNYHIHMPPLHWHGTIARTQMVDTWMEKVAHRARGVIRRNVNKLGEDNISHFGLIKAKTTSSLFSETTLIQTF